jgi:hypothetical protein
MHAGDWDRSLYDQPEMDAIEERAEHGDRIDTGTLRAMLTEQQRREVGRLLGTRWEVSARGVWPAPARCGPGPAGKGARWPPSPASRG